VFIKACNWTPSVGSLIQFMCFGCHVAILRSVADVAVTKAPYFLHVYCEASRNHWRQVVMAPKIFMIAPRIFCILFWWFCVLAYYYLTYLSYMWKNSIFHFMTNMPKMLLPCLIIILTPSFWKWLLNLERKFVQACPTFRYLTFIGANVASTSEVLTNVMLRIIDLWNYELQN
jgi:hypothetical protein